LKPARPTSGGPALLVEIFDIHQTARAEVINDDDVISVAYQPFSQVRADKAGPAGN
jgi:hypothetical protein